MKDRCVTAGVIWLRSGESVGLVGAQQVLTHSKRPGTYQCFDVSLTYIRNSEISSDCLYFVFEAQNDLVALHSAAFDLLPQTLLKKLSLTVNNALRLMFGVQYHVLQLFLYGCFFWSELTGLLM